MRRNGIASTLIALSLSFGGVCFAQREQGDIVPMEPYATSYAPQWAYTANETNLRAGPSRDYPVVAVLSAGVWVSVQGCLSDYRWCDVVAEPYRGWAYAGNIGYEYQGSPVPVLSFGEMIGIGILTFSIAHYWDRHYRTSPWYPQRDYWIGRPPIPIGPGGYRPPARGPGFEPYGGYRPPHVQGPRGVQRPPQWHGPSAGQRPPQSQVLSGKQQPPQASSPVPVRRPPQGHRTDGAPVRHPDAAQQPPQVQGSGEQRPPQSHGSSGEKQPHRGQGSSGGQKQSKSDGR